MQSPYLIRNYITVGVFRMLRKVIFNFRQPFLFVCSNGTYFLNKPFKSGFPVMITLYWSRPFPIWGTVSESR